MIHLKINLNFLNKRNKYTKLESCCSVTKRFSKIKGTPLFCIYLPLNSHQYVAFHLNKSQGCFNVPLSFVEILKKLKMSKLYRKIHWNTIQTSCMGMRWIWFMYTKNQLKKTMYMLKCCNLILQSFNLDWNDLSAKDESPKPLIV